MKIDLDICPEYKRDKARIDVVLEVVKKVWSINHDLRFLQLMSNIIDQLRLDGIDPFFLEDEEFIIELKNLKDRWKDEKRN